MQQHSVPQQPVRLQSDPLMMFMELMQVTMAVVQTLNGLSAGAPLEGGKGVSWEVRVVVVHLHVRVLVEFLRLVLAEVEVQRRIQLFYEVEGKPGAFEFNRIPEVRRLREDVHSFMQDVRGALSKVGLMESQSKSSSGK